MAGLLHRRSLLKAAAAAAGGLAAGAAFPFISGGDARRGEKNVFLIIADAMRADAVGKVINGVEVTPFLNRMARDGVFFSRAFSAAAATKFSMASIFTGLYPPGHGVEYHMYTVPECPTLAGYLSELGCRTFGVTCNPFMSPEIGVGGVPTDLAFGFKEGFFAYRTLESPDEARSEYGESARPSKTAPYADGKVVNEHVFRLLANYTPSAGEDARGSFFYIHYMDSHQPWVKPHPTRHTGVFHDRSMLRSLGVEGVLKRDHEVIHDIFVAGKPPGEEERETVRAIYYEACAYADECIGEVALALKERGIYDDSMIIVTADHGDELYEHGCIGHGQNLYNTVLRVPLVVTGPAYRAAEVDGMVTNAAILPTLMDLRGEEMTHTTVPSFAGALRGDAPARHSIFAGFIGQDKIILPSGCECMSTPPSDAAAHGGAPWLYFDISSDPNEMRSLREDPRVFAALEKERYHSRRLAAAAGIERAYSTYHWQNPLAETQDALAAAAVREGRLSEKEAVRLKSRGEFIPEKGRGTKEAIELNEDALTAKQRAQMKALGYLN